MNIQYYFTENGIFELLESVFAGGDSSDMRFFVYIIAALVAVGYFILSVFDKDNAIWLSILLLAIGFSEFCYNANEAEFIWFCKEPRWWWIAINFLLYAAVCFGQGTLLTKQAFLASQGMPYIGLYSVPVCLVALYIAVYFYHLAVPWVIWLFLLCQFIQAIIILVQTTRYDNFFKAIIHAVAYLVAMFSSLILGYHLLFMLIFVALGVVAFKFLEGASSSTTSCAPNRINGWVYTSGGNKFVRLDNGDVHEIWGESDTGVLRDSAGMSWYTSNGIGNAYSHDVDK